MALPTAPADRSDFPSLAAYWAAELNAYQRTAQHWYEVCQRIITRYRLARAQDVDWRQNTKRFNILYSNIQTLLPALFSHAPVPVVERRFKDDDRVGRLASMVLNRALVNELEVDDMHAIGERVVLDMLLTGRGVLWTRYEPDIVAERVNLTPSPEGQLYLTSDGEMLTPDDSRIQFEEERPAYILREHLIGERVPVEYVHWGDFAHTATARNWPELVRDGWIGRRSLLTKEAGLARFGEIFEQVPAAPYRPMYQDQANASDIAEKAVIRRSEVWEIWDAKTREVVWTAPGFTDDVLDRRPPPVEIKEFFPATVIYGSLTNEDLIPTPDYQQYRAFAEELDTLTERTTALLDALRVRGAYDATLSGLGSLLSGASDDMTLVAVQNVKDQNLAGAVQWLPIDTIVNVLSNLYAARDKSKQDLFEVSGLADIIRGQVDPREKAAQSELKAQAAGQRIGRQQIAVSQGLERLIQLKAEIMCQALSPDTLRTLSGYDYLPEVSDMRAMNPQQVEMDWAQIVQLLHADQLRGFRIAVETQTNAWVNQQAEAQSRQEFLQTAGGFLAQALPLAQAVPQLAPLMGELLLFAIRSHRAGRTLEGKFEEAVQQLTGMAQPPPPAPAQAPAQPAAPEAAQIAPEMLPPETLQ